MDFKNPIKKNWEGKGWSKDKGGVERGKDYNHSGFCDLVLSDLLGIKKPSINNSIEINPLIPQGLGMVCSRKYSLPRQRNLIDMG